MIVKTEYSYALCTGVRMSPVRVFMEDGRWGLTCSEKRSRVWRGRAEGKGVLREPRRGSPRTGGLEQGRLEMVLSRAEAWLMVGSFESSSTSFLRQVCDGKLESRKIQSRLFLEDQERCMWGTC